MRDVALKDVLCGLACAKKSENSGTPDNWKTALFLSGQIRGTFFDVWKACTHQRHAAAREGLLPAGAEFREVR
jgi:hypothetical protein